MRNDIAVLYATMTGNSRECAEKTTALLIRGGLPARLHDLARYDPRSLLEETTVILTISTWGRESRLMMQSISLATSTILNNHLSANCASRSSHWETPAMTTSASAARTWIACSRKRVPPACSTASTMMLIFMMRLKRGRKPSSLRCKTPWQLRSQLSPLERALTPATPLAGLSFLRPVPPNHRRNNPVALWHRCWHDRGSSTPVS
jgi:flavodoxin